MGGLDRADRASVNRADRADRVINEVGNKIKYKPKPAWLIDSSIYVYNAWHRSKHGSGHQHSNLEKIDIHGNPFNAVCGFLEFVYRLLSIEKPELIAFAFDETLKTSHRKQIYPQYKANRSPAPASLRRQFQYCRQFLRAFGLYENASFYYEADDLIGTWAKSLREQHIPVNIITADKDLAQLVYEDDCWWEYERGQRLDSKAISKKFKAKPHQIADQLAIAGDKSDNIPGVPGIGMSTAGKLLRKFDNLENLLASIAEISTMQIRGAAHIQQLIEEHQETIQLARQLTGIKCNIEEIQISNFKISPINKDALSQLFIELDLSDETQDKWLNLHKEL